MAWASEVSFGHFVIVRLYTGIEIDAKNLNSVLDVIMTIKFDMIFEGIHDKCRIVFNNLIPCIEEKCMYSDIFLLKHMESLVNQMNSSREINLSLEEHLLTNAVHMMECLITDPGKVILLKFLFGNTEG